jgi:Helix-turn-helix domain
MAGLAPAMDECELGEWVSVRDFDGDVACVDEIRQRGEVCDVVAGRLLRDADEPLSAIAARVGYSSEFAFANAFKREYGTAPGRYRRSTRLQVPDYTTNSRTQLARHRRAASASSRLAPVEVSVSCGVRLGEERH